MKRTRFRTKANAKRHRGAGRRVYKTKAGWTVSPECPRGQAKRRALIRQRTATRRPKRTRPATAGFIRVGVKMFRKGSSGDIPF